MNAGPPSDGLTLLGVFHCNWGLGKQSTVLAPEELMWKWGLGRFQWLQWTYTLYKCKYMVIAEERPRANCD